uniref:Reverse transcriptase Ty1/copia-type domain-containing protein n=1 Tax=Cannabis sativa TaxID=3483 RepID=A0A803NSA7_CANSA
MQLAINGFTNINMGDGAVIDGKPAWLPKGTPNNNGVDYLDTFAPVAKFNTLKILLALASHQNWSLHQLDINNAFLHGDLHEDVYMTLPQGYKPKHLFHPMHLPQSVLMEIKKKQATVSRSSIEAEYRAMANATCEATWITSLLQYFPITHRLPANLYCDNAAAIHISENLVFHERTKHVEINCHIVREKL